MRLLIVSNMDHYLRGGRVVGAWDAAVREVDALAELFDEIRHIATLQPGTAPAQARPYASKRVQVIPMRPRGGTSLADKLRVAAGLPAAARLIRRELFKADAVHLRAPAGIMYAALPTLALTKGPSKRWVKYAGDWRPPGRDPLSFRIQRFWLRRFPAGARVSVNGEFDNQREHIVPFPNPSFSGTEARQAALETSDKRLTPPLRLVFVGRLHPRKGAATALEITARLRDSGFEARLDIAGDGPEKERLGEMIRELRLTGQATLHGWLGRPALTELYRRAHFVTLPSKGAEGWPKALSEGMAYRAVPIAGNVGGVASALRSSRAGMALPPEDIDAWISCIASLAGSPERWLEMADRAQAAAAGYTYGAYLERVRETLDLGPRPAGNSGTSRAPETGVPVKRLRRWNACSAAEETGL